MQRSTVPVQLCFLLAALLPTLCSALSGPFSEYNASFYQHRLNNGRPVFVPVEVVNRINDDNNKWHWIPYLRPRTTINDNVVTAVECISSDSMSSFPNGIFTDEQLRYGGFVMYALLGIYSFTLLAYVCNYYFIPTVENICDILKIPQDVAAATFMAVATSCPEFFVNLISTFLTESDMGVGTIVGSAIFNALGVAAIGGLAAIRPISIDPRAVTRDVLIYMVNVTVLVTIVWDGEVAWYEALVLGILYICYFIVMFNSVRLFKVYDKYIGSCCSSGAIYDNDAEVYREKSDVIQHDDTIKSEITITNSSTEKIIDSGYGDEKTEIQEDEENFASLWRYPLSQSAAQQIWWLYSWPVRCALFLTIPSPRRKSLFPLTFVMCIVWIGGNSYLISWSMTVIGHTFEIPDSVMGMTFLAFGGCLPEACAIFIMSRRGEGGMGVSNALGANSLSILFALGMSWLIKTLTLVFQDADVTVVYINSSGIDFVVASLLVAVAALWTTLYFGKFILRKSVGTVLLCLYSTFVIFAVLMELGIIVEKDIPFC